MSAPGQPIIQTQHSLARRKTMLLNAFSFTLISIVLVSLVLA